MKKNLMKAAAVALTLAMAAGALGLSGCAKVAAPSGVGSIELKAGASEGGGAAVTAQWAAADGAAGYEVRCYIAGEGGSEGAPAAEAAPGEDVSGTQCRFDGLAYGQQYTVEVEPYAEGRSGAHVGGEPMAATVSTGAAPVTGLALEANADEAEGEAYVKATWPASEGADGYLVKIEEAGPAAADAAEATADAADTADADAADADAPDAAAETASDKAITDQTAAGTAEAAGTADAPAGTPAADAPAQPGDDADAGADAITDEGATAVTGTEHTFTGLAYGQAYTVTVAAYADGEDGRTVSAATAAEAATGVPALCAPSLTATGASTSEIQLAWDPVEGATGYTLRCGASADAIGDILYEAGADETGYVNGPLGEGATVYYTIAPRFGGHEYAQSEAASATTKVTPKPAAKAKGSAGGGGSAASAGGSSGGGNDAGGGDPGWGDAASAPAGGGEMHEYYFAQCGAQFSTPEEARYHAENAHTVVDLDSPGPTEYISERWGGCFAYSAGEAYAQLKASYGW